MRPNSIIAFETVSGERVQHRLPNPLIIIPVSTIAVLSLFHLGRNSFWLDEAYSVTFVNLPWPQLADLVSRAEANMALYYVLLKIWVGWFGDSEFAARLLSALFAMAGVAMTYGVGVQLFSIRVGFLSAILLAVNAFFISFAQEARGYTLLLLLTGISMFLFIRWVERQTYRNALTLGLVNVLLLYSHIFGIFALLAQAMSLAFLAPRTVRWRSAAASALFTMTLSVPLGVFILTRESLSLGWIAKSSLRSIIDLFLNITGGGGKPLLMSYFLPCLLSVAALAKAGIQFKRSRTVWRYALLFCWLFVPILSIYLLSLFKPFFIYRYMFFCLPALVLLTGLGLQSFRSKALCGIAASVPVLLSLYTVVDVYYPKQKEDWRSATSFVVQHAQPGDGILFYSKPAKVPFEYYYRKMSPAPKLVSVYPFAFGTLISVHMLTKSQDPSQTMLSSLSKTHDRLWVVLSYDRIEGMGWNSRVVLDAIEKSYVSRESLSLTDIQVKLYEAGLGIKRGQYAP